MSAAAEPFAKPNGVALSLRYALRELRGGLRGFYVFIACIALGVMAIAGVGSVSASLSDGLAREGRTLLGGDVSFVLFQRRRSRRKSPSCVRAAPSRAPPHCAAWRARPRASWRWSR